MQLRYRLLLFIITALAPACASAFNVFKVDPNCVAAGAYDTIQDAVNQAAATAGTDYVWISNGHHTTTYANEHVTIANDVDGVIIEGGFADCNDNDPGTDTTTISGGGPVFDISGNSQVYFGNLVITGGIRFFGQGSLTLGAYADVSGNHGATTYGGGVRLEAYNGNATLNLQDNARIHDNEATFGGGIFVSGGSAGSSARLLALSPGVQIANNTAAYGGGIDIEGRARADISTNVQSNTAGLGGGVYVNSGAVLRMFPRDAAHPPGLFDNTATYGTNTGNGGAIYALGDVCLFNPSISGNAAVAGAAIYQKAGGTYVNGGFPARLGVECGPEPVSALGGESSLCIASGCSLIEGNTTGVNGPYTGPVWYVGGELVASRLRLQWNAGSYAFETHGAQTTLHTCLVTDNNVLGVLSADGGGSTLSACTVANDTLLANAYVFRFLNGAAGTLTDDIIDEPGHISALTSGPLLANNVLSNDISTLPASASVITGDPLFVANNDYHLAYKSPAVDFAPAIGGVDLDGSARDIDLSQVANRFGPADLGAYEKQFAFACDASNDAIFCSGFEPP